MVRCASLFIALLMLVSAAGGQRGHRDPTPVDRNANPDRGLVANKIDPIAAKQDAEELSRLASTLPTAVDHAAGGIVAKDLKDKLKRIEKLSKRLRAELALY